MKTLIKLIVILFALGFFVSMFSTKKPNRTESVAPAPIVQSTPKPTPAKTPEKKWTEADKVKAESIIAGLQKERVIGEVLLENKIVKVEVEPRFYTLNLKDKANFANTFMVWGLAADADTSMVRMKDIRTGKTVATFSPMSGFAME